MTRRLRPTSIPEGMVPSSILTTIIKRRGGDRRCIGRAGAGQLAAHTTVVEATLQLGSIRGISLKELGVKPLAWSTSGLRQVTGIEAREKLKEGEKKSRRTLVINMRT